MVHDLIVYGLEFAINIFGLFRHGCGEKLRRINIRVFQHDEVTEPAGPFILQFVGIRIIGKHLFAQERDIIKT